MFAKLDAFARRSDFRAFGFLALRLVLGLLFVFAGYGKLTDLAMASGFFETLGIPAAGFFALLVGLVEFLGGLALIAGVFFVPAAFFLAVIMLVAFLTTQLGMPFMEMAPVLSYLAALLVLMGTGPGAWVLSKRR